MADRIYQPHEFFTVDQFRARMDRFHKQVLAEMSPSDARSDILGMLRRATIENYHADGRPRALDNPPCDSEVQFRNEIFDLACLVAAQKRRLSILQAIVLVLVGAWLSRLFFP